MYSKNKRVLLVRTHKAVCQLDLQNIGSDYPLRSSGSIFPKVYSPKLDSIVIYNMRVKVLYCACLPGTHITCDRDNTRWCEAILGPCCPALLLQPTQKLQHNWPFF